ncbi:TetR/AcrR family transcriptional regulator [Staphylococcus agnetis]|uniref:TetR family transcriptional regulator n=1 Tax=Staphylococcus agnetis TaxID=985762 RepID=A0ABX3Z2P7_9STAP|nr:TetR/AcrR family transcriptional regulator [Staphylococcus agnetis]ALN77581.1 TetR/AcrR family transcriptional regulator [Staphylococcus agnetis]OSP19096.1 TetR family transcriptional regulator [Staphylococcus agnetis]OSP24287.1 TetR family transcriptional regulator [Staphylococcus agnetis]OTW30027.1 TetR family transcriptional regulator [Staphylococcus agnetis]
MNKQDLRVLKTQKAFMHAFTELLKTKAFDRITVQDLCDRALVQRSTFYRHYKDKYHLLTCATEHALTRITQEHVSAIRSDNATLRLEQYIDNLLTYVYDNQVILRHVISHYMHDEVTSIIYKQVYLAVRQQTHAELLSGKRLDIDTDVFNHFIAGGLISIMLNWSNQNDTTRTIENLKTDIVTLIDRVRTTHLKSI